MSRADGSRSASRFSTLIDASSWVMRRNEETRDNAHRLITRAKRAHEAAKRLIDDTRDVILTFRRHRFRAISGASGGRAGLHESVWISTAVSQGAQCTECGRAIVVGEAMYDVVADGREIRLDADCGRFHMEQRRSRPEKPLRRVS